MRILPSRGAHLVVPRERIPNKTGLTIRVPGQDRVPRPVARSLADRHDRRAVRGARRATVGGRLGGRPAARHRQRDDGRGPDAGRRRRHVRRAAAADRAVRTGRRSRRRASTASRSSANGVVRIGGGKYTTYRVMARDVIDAVLGRDAARSRPSETAERRLVGAADTDALARIAGELATIPAVAARRPGRRRTARRPARDRGAGRRRARRRAGLLAAARRRPAVPRGRGRLGGPPRAGARRSTTSSPGGRGWPRSCPTAAPSIAPRVAAIVGRRARLGRRAPGLEVEAYLASARREFAVAAPERAVPPGVAGPRRVGSRRSQPATDGSFGYELPPGTDPATSPARSSGASSSRTCSRSLHSAPSDATHRTKVRSMQASNERVPSRLQTPRKRPWPERSSTQLGLLSRLTRENPMGSRRLPRGVSFSCTATRT